MSMKRIGKIKANLIKALNTLTKCWDKVIGGDEACCVNMVLDQDVEYLLLDLATAQQAEINRIRAERDALLEEIPHACYTCIHEGEPYGGVACDGCTGEPDAWNTHVDNWQWRGVKEADHG